MQSRSGAGRVACVLAAAAITSVTPRAGRGQEKRVGLLDFLRGSEQITVQHGYFEGMRLYFDPNGFNLATAGDELQLTLGGRLQVDWNVSDPGRGVQQAFDLQGTDSGVELRRARVKLDGLIYDTVDFKVEYDFATGEPDYKDVYVGVRHLPLVQSLRVGHFKEPFSLEQLMSSNWVTFQERATMNAFVPGRNTGIAIRQTHLDERLTFSAGGFHHTDDLDKAFGSNESYNVTARVTGLPLYAPGTQLLHLGFAYSHQFRDDVTISFQSRPEARLFPVALVDTGSIATDGVDLINPEVAAVMGPVSLQAEYARAFVTQVAGPDPAFDGFYIQASWFVTGESRAAFYRTGAGEFDRIFPHHDVSLSGGHWGAWELAARFSRLDLDSENVRGGTLDDITAGINWYLTPNLRVTVNYVWAHLESVGDSNIVEGRFQVAF